MAGAYLLTHHRQRSCNSACPASKWNQHVNKAVWHACHLQYILVGGGCFMQLLLHAQGMRLHRKEHIGFHAMQVTQTVHAFMRACTHDSSCCSTQQQSSAVQCSTVQCNAMQPHVVIAATGNVLEDTTQTATKDATVDPNLTTSKQSHVDLSSGMHNLGRLPHISAHLMRVLS